jgi:hypothetical protein
MSQTDVLVKQMLAFQEQGRYQEALEANLQIARINPALLSDAWGNAALNCVRVHRWHDAIRYGQYALMRGENAGNTLHDALAHAHGMLGQWDEARHHGLLALNLRANFFSSEKVILLPPLSTVPPPPCARTRECNIIAFSLFGRDSKYCETAILNVQDQPSVYPYWVCRFYIDDSVPKNVINRLRDCGAQIVRVDGPVAQWPGEMWRLLALNDPQAHRILFRDADSIISLREAHAVEQWIASDKRFHMMRDNGACTELILAGLWGVVAGSLPPLDRLMERFMRVPLESRHFADQRFLRQYIWPYARTSLMQHDSVFGFMDAVSFPDGKKADGFCVGNMESVTFCMKVDLSDGSDVSWALYLIERRDGDRALVKLVCSYTNTVQDGIVKVYIPKRYAQWIEQGTACIRTIESRSA